MLAVARKFCGVGLLNWPSKGACHVRISSLGLDSSRGDADASIERNDARVTGPDATPSEELSAEQAVRVQLEALARNNEPTQDHGLEVMYLFANAEGGFEAGGSLPCYFGTPQDLYHFGHFALKFKTRYPELLNLESFEIVESGTNRVVARVKCRRKKESTWEFFLSKVQRGGKSLWLTDHLLKKSK